MHHIILPVRTLPRVLPRTTCLRANGSAFSTSSRQLLHKPSPHAQPKRATQCSSSIQLCQRIRQPLGRRCNSSAPAVNAGEPAPKPSAEPLTWNRFLELRKTRRRISLVSSIIFAAGGAGAGLVILSTWDIDFMQFGIDPTFVIGGVFIGCALSGWLVGPFFGTAAFNMVYRSLTRQIAQKENEFYNRIKKFRVDPTSSSMQNPVPDYYGEKIGSVADYRRWLKDQRAFNLKRGKML